MARNAGQVLEPSPFMSFRLPAYHGFSPRSFAQGSAMQMRCKAGKQGCRYWPAWETWLSNHGQPAVGAPHQPGPGPAHKSAPSALMAPD